MGHFQQHVDRRTLCDGVPNLELWGYLVSDCTSFLDLFQGLVLQIIVEILRRDHTFCIQELRYGVARSDAQGDFPLHRRICCPTDGVL